MKRQKHTRRGGTAGPLRRRKGQQALTEAALVWLECARCGGDVWAPEDTEPTCDRCTLQAAIKEPPRADPK